MQTVQHLVQSVPATHFTEALAQNAKSAMYNLPGLPTAGPRRWFIRAIMVETQQNFAPEFNFFTKAAGDTDVLATDAYVGRWGFSKGMGEQLGGGALWRYYNDQMALPVRDQDGELSTVPPLLHVVLQNTDPIAKSAGAGGQILVQFWLEPMVATQG